MNEERAYSIWKSFDNQRQGFRRYARQRFKTALVKQAEPYLKAENLEDRPEISEQPIKDAFTDVYLRVGSRFSQNIENQLKAGGVEFTCKRSNEQLISSWLEVNTTQLITNITETTRRGILIVLQQTLQEGGGIDQFRRKLRESYFLSDARSELIGRTEIIRASNAGAQLGAKNTGVPMRKVWVSTRDGRTRTDHAAVDGQTVESIDSEFIVGGEAAKYPADPNLSAGQSINCRCVVSYEPY